MASKLPKIIPTAIMAVLLVFTASREGLRTTAYKDVGGIPTICYGDTGNVKLGQTSTRDECLERLKQDEQGAYENLGHYVTIALSGGEQVAYTDFIYNVGSGSFQRSTLLRKLNSGERRGACGELRKWVYVEVNGKSVVSNGLKTRREAEYQQCIKDLPK